MAAPLVRIGELARRAGVPAATLRAWERRYGIVEPTRTDGGYRLYSEEDERRLRSMLDLITRGVAPAEAAARVLRGEAEPERSPAERPVGAGADELRDQLFERLADFDEVGAHRAIDRAVAAYSSEALVGQILLPVLRQTGEWWHAGRLTVGQEHFASNLIRGRVMALGRGWGAGQGPLALLACPPDEEHDLGLLCFGLLLRERGWRIAFLGADTPFEALAAASERLQPARVVLPVSGSASAKALAAHGPLDLAAPLAVAGAAADEELAGALGAELMPDEIAAAAERLAATVPGT